MLDPFQNSPIYNAFMSEYNIHQVELAVFGKILTDYGIEATGIRTADVAATMREQFNIMYQIQGDLTAHRRSAMLIDSMHARYRPESTWKPGNKIPNGTSVKTIGYSAALYTSDPKTAAQVLTELNEKSIAALVKIVASNMKKWIRYTNTLKMSVRDHIPGRQIVITNKEDAPANIRRNRVPLGVAKPSDKKKNNKYAGMPPSIARRLEK